jgi:3-phosphoshikimate 1-carboxyvinyltransferase
MATNLNAMGANVTPTDDGMIIEGGHPLHGASIHCKYDHRIAMTFTIAGINADGETDIVDSECVEVSYPTFFEDLGRL